MSTQREGYRAGILEVCDIIDDELRLQRTLLRSREYAGGDLILLCELHILLRLKEKAMALVNKL